MGTNKELLASKGKPMKYLPSQSYRKSLSFIDALFSFGLYLTLGAACVSNLRVTPSGPEIMLEGGGYPFLYEFGVAAVLFATFLRFFQGIPLPTKRQKLALLGLALFYVPIFSNFIFRSFDMFQFIGGGQLRLQLEAWLFGVAMIVYPVSIRTINRALIVVVVMAIVNSVYTIAIFYGIVDPLYTRAWRTLGGIRYSGFFDMPSRIGVISAIAIAWALWRATKIYYLILITLICSFAVIIADTRTGMVGILMVASARSFAHRKTPQSLTVAVSIFLITLAILTVYFMPDPIWALHADRTERILMAVQIWMDNPFGVGWAEQAVFPHNWPVMALLVGGVVSFVPVVVFHAWIIRKFMIYRGVLSGEKRLRAALVLMMIALTVTSYFEQVFLEAHALMIVMFAFGSILQMEKKEHLKFIKNYSLNKALSGELHLSRPYMFHNMLSA